MKFTCAARTELRLWYVGSPVNIGHAKGIMISGRPIDLYFR